MRILHFSPSFLPVTGGAQIVVHNLAIQQRSRGHDVSVLTSYNNWKDLKIDLGYSVLPLIRRSPTYAHLLEEMIPGLGRRFVARQVKRLYKKSPFDVFHVHTAYPAGFFASYVGRTLEEVRTVVTCHGVGVQILSEIGYGYRLRPKLAKRISKGLASYDSICVVGEHMKTDLLELGIDMDKVSHIPNGTDVERIRSQPFDRKEIYRRYGIPQNSHLLICVGRNHPIKGYRFIPGIVHALLRKRRDFIFAVIGKGTDELLEAAKRLGVDDYLRLITEIPAVSGNPDPLGNFSVPSTELISHLKSSDIFVFPTLLEATTPLAVVEAMAAGLPIVTTDAPGAGESIKEGFNGYCTPAGDVLEMADKIDRLLADPEKRRRMSENCLKTAQKLRWKIISRRYEYLYSSRLLKNAI